MRATVSRRVLAEALSVMSGAAATTPAIMASILVEAARDPGSLRLSVVDYGLMVQHAMGCAGETEEVAEGGAVLVSARALARMVSALEGSAEVLLYTRQSRLVVKCGGSTFALPASEEVDLFPDTTTAAGAVVAGVVPAALLAQLVGRVYPVTTSDAAMAAGAAELTLAGGEGGVVSATATDGQRVVISGATALPPDAPRAVLSDKALSALSALCGAGGQDDEVTLSVGGRHLVAERGAWRLVSVLSEARLPDCEAVIPAVTDDTVQAEVGGPVLLAALRRVALVGGGRMDGVRLEVKDGHLTAVLSNPDLGSARERVRCESPDWRAAEGRAVVVRLRYALEAAAALEGYGRVLVQWHDRWAMMRPGASVEMGGQRCMCLIAAMQLARNDGVSS